MTVETIRPAVLASAGVEDLARVQPTAPAVPALTVPQVGIDCRSCEVPFAAVSSQGEAEYLAGVHNQLQHGGGQVAGPVTGAVAGFGGAVAGLGWSADPAVLADAQVQAFPFAGERTAIERAWSARVQAAVDGIDVLDPGGMDVWMDRHATAQAPHMAEAELVAVWETHVRRLADDLDAGTAPAGDVAEGAPVVDVVELDDVDEDGWD